MRGPALVAVTHSSGNPCTRREAIALAVVLAGAAAGYGGDRRRPITGGPCAAAAAPGGLPPKGRGEKLPPRNGETPGLNPGRLRRVTLAAHSLATARARTRCSRPGRSGRRAEGAPLKT
jgi:hypothetical protein